MSLQNAPLFEVATVEGSYYINLGIDGKFSTHLSPRDNKTNTKPFASGGRSMVDSSRIRIWTRGQKCVSSAQKYGKSSLKGQDPIGKEVIINNFGNNKRFTVIGIMESRGDGLERGKSDDNMLFIPITTAQKRFLGTRSRWTYHGTCQKSVSRGSGTQRGPRPLLCGTMGATTPFSEPGPRNRASQTPKE